MTRHKVLRRFGALASASLIAFSSLAQGADDDVIEEVVVTGSYIKGSPLRC